MSFPRVRRWRRAVFAVLTLATLVASCGLHIWSQRFGGTTADVGQVVTTDAAGNILVAGFFTGSVNLGGGSINSPGTDIFLAKYSPTGQYLWAVHTGNGGSNNPLGIAADPNGNVVI